MQLPEHSKSMATRRVSADAVVSYFTGDDDGLEEMFFAGSDDDLGMEDELSEDGSDNEEQECNGDKHAIA